MGRLLFSLLAVLSLTAVSVHAQGQRLNASDRRLLEKLAQANIAEVELGQIAEKSASSQAVKDYGRRMVRDHGNLSRELTTFASQRGLTLPTEPSPEQVSHTTMLMNKTGAAFDQAYMQHMVADHDKDIAEVRNGIQATRDPQVKQLLERTLPTLEEHQRLGQQVASSVGVSTQRPSK